MMNAYGENMTLEEFYGIDASIELEYDTWLQNLAKKVGK